MRDRNEKTPEAAGAGMRHFIPHLFYWMSMAVVWIMTAFSLFGENTSQLDILQGLLLAVMGIGMANYFKIGLISDE